jgi:serine/threonine-protein kinase
VSAVALLAAVLADRYRLERELGKGGSAAVYLPQDQKHHRKMGLEVLPNKLRAHRFLHDILTLAKPPHPPLRGRIARGSKVGSAATSPMDSE